MAGIAISDFITFFLPPTGTNWSCGVVEDLKLIARNGRVERKRLLQWGNFMNTLGYVIGLTTLILATANIMLQLPIISVLIPIFQAVLMFTGFPILALSSYDTAFELTDIIENARVELLLPVSERIDGAIYLRIIQIDINSTLLSSLQNNVYAGN